SSNGKQKCFQYFGFAGLILSPGGMYTHGYVIFSIPKSCARQVGMAKIFLTQRARFLYCPPKKISFDQCQLIF
ncbi:MAG TPA: hypothetical protein PLJ49_09665, partial [Smithella sp.]|nr:hypothetical protein [Smithella sp.]